MQRDIAPDLVHHQDGLPTLSSLLSPAPFGPLDSPISLAHGAHSGIESPGSGLGSGGATTDTFDATTGNIGFDAAAYARVLHHHQMLLRQTNEEYRRLRCVAFITHSISLPSDL
jgi:hypothetical protein